jgi:hypothetical protein
MKNRSLKLVVSFILVMIVACDEPETVVTDVVHPDGSVTRKIEMKNLENKFEISKIQVPFDSTWTVRDSIEITGKDTTWVKRAEKLFRNVDEINQAYIADSGSNKDVTRNAGFKKTFKWFSTDYRFEESVDKKLEYGYPVTDFLNPEELGWFYSQDIVNDEKKNSPDSLQYRTLSDTINKKTDRWATMSLVSEWINTFSKLSEGKTGEDMSLQSLKARENVFVKILEDNNGEKFDSLWNNGILLKEFIGESNALKYKTEADSAIVIVTNKFFVSFDDYTQKIIMPGKLIGTSGVIDSTGALSWQVKSDYFLTQDFKMWAESKTPNRWAWIVTGVFLFFVLAGVIYKTIKK